MTEVKVKCEGKARTLLIDSKDKAIEELQVGERLLVFDEVSRAHIEGFILQIKKKSDGDAK